MPTIAIYKEQLITPEDIYKFNIDKSSEFTCYNCDKQVHFRQKRNMENNYTEHFYHPNTVKDTHIECENLTIDKVKDVDTWHNKLSNFIENENREIIRRNGEVKHIVDAFDPLNNMGIEFQNSPITVEAIQSRDATTHLDWIFNVENQYIRIVEIGNKVICEIPHESWEKAIKVVKNNVFLYTGKKEWICLEDRENYRIELEGKLINVWIGTPCSFQDIYDSTCLQNMLSEVGKDHFLSFSVCLDSVKIIYARCKKSMFLLDKIHRDYVNTHVFTKGDILAVKSVAGSGKTTTLLNLSKINKKKRILYLAFNKSLIEEIKGKIKDHKIGNLFPFTFDALIYDCYTIIKNKRPEIKMLSPQTIKDISPWLDGKPFRLRKDCVDEYNKFCNNSTILNINQFTDKKLVLDLWKQTLKGELLTFEALRKLSLIQKWFKNYIDTKYDMVMIDETQDFDMLMLRMLLDDTTIPKIFVGDPKQSIYQWRGCINGFNHMPKGALIIEFYSTFRVGDPACETIRKQFDDCWMISKSKNTTNIVNNVSSIEGAKYTYLFRTWRKLLTTASLTPDIWINNYDIKIQDIRRKHAILSKNKSAFEADEFEDDLPTFLKSITEDQLEEMIQNIENNMVAKEDAKCKMYTIHGYKGLEDDNIRIADDVEIDPSNNIPNNRIISPEKRIRMIEEAVNISYVALTRGMKYIIMDNISMIDNRPELNNINDLMQYITRIDIPKVVITPEVNYYALGNQTKISDYFK
jgi:F-box protein, helicase, 18